MYNPEEDPRAHGEGEGVLREELRQLPRQGRGGGRPAAKALKPPPENLVTHPMKGGAPAVFEVLGKGVKGTGMIAFKHLSEDERWALAYFVEGLGRATK